MDLQDLRDSIDEIDGEIIRLFEKRMETAKSIAQYKKENGLPVADRTREREVIHQLTEKVPQALAPYTKGLYTTLFELSKSYQSSVLRGPSKIVGDIQRALEKTENTLPAHATIACQGTEGAYSQFACERLFSSYPSILYMDSFGAVFRAVDSGLCRYGILPVENSTAGSVTAVYELMQSHKFYIVGSTKLFVDHTLLANAPVALSDIKEVFSHEQALNQCSDFLSKMPGVKLRACKNTALAAKELSQSGRTDAAVISSRDCAALYNLREIASGIANTQNNYTRFICISKEPEIYPGADRTSLMVRLPHKPGALYSVLSRFFALGVNLTKLESRPLSGTNFEFMFFFDIAASVYSEELTELLAQLESELPEITYLGSYHDF